MLKAQHHCVQALAMRGGIFFVYGAPSVDLIPQYGMAQVRHMYPDLVSPAGLQAALHQ